MTEATNMPTGFDGLGIAPGLLAQLEKLQFKQPTPIQAKAIPIATKGDDVVGIAQTGTGKTLAFAIPMIQRLATTNHQAGLIIVPTRELALQVDKAISRLAVIFNLRTVVLIGGAPMQPQKRAIQGKPRIIIATPGRLNDHLGQRTISLSNVSILVLDEADRMLDMGFAPQVKQILMGVPKDRQTMLFSATMPNEIAQIARSYMRRPLRVEVAPSGTTVERVEQEVFIVSRNQKLALLQQLLSQYHGTVLIFSRTKYGAKKLAHAIRGMGHNAAEIHSNLSLNQRRKSLDGFRSGQYRILAATDIAARGIDVTDIEVVINYDLPDDPDAYVHRIGRTARAGKAGKAISFVAPEQRQDLAIIERLIRARLPIKPLPSNLPRVAAASQMERPERRPRQLGRSYSSARPHRPGSPSRHASSDHSRHGTDRSSHPQSSHSQHSRPPAKKRFRYFTGGNTTGNRQV